MENHYCKSTTEDAKDTLLNNHSQSLCGAQVVWVTVLVVVTYEVWVNVTLVLTVMVAAVQEVVSQRGVKPRGESQPLVVVLVTVKVLVMVEVFVIV